MMHPAHKIGYPLRHSMVKMCGNIYTTSYRRSIIKSFILSVSPNSTIFYLQALTNHLLERRSPSCHPPPRRNHALTAVDLSLSPSPCTLDTLPSSFRELTPAWAQQYDARRVDGHTTLDTIMVRQWRVGRDLQWSGGLCTKGASGDGDWCVHDEGLG